MGAYVVRTSSLNDKHCCQLFRMGLRDKTAPTPLIRANMGCAVATIFSSLAFLFSSVSMANLSRLVAASFINLSCLLAPPSPVLGFSPNSLWSPRFNLLRVARICLSWFSVMFSYFYSVSDALFAFSFLSERFFFVHAKSVTCRSFVCFNRPKLTLSMRVFGPRNSAYAFWDTKTLYQTGRLPIIEAIILARVYR